MAPHAYLLRAGRALLGDDELLTPDAAVAVVGRRILWAGPRAELPEVLRGLDECDLGGLTLLPGLIDAHVHLAFDTGPDPAAALAAVDDTVLLKEMTANAHRHLLAGVTTVRDLGARSFLDVAVARATAADPALGARVVPAGAPITVPDGHCWYLGGACADDDAVADRIRLSHDSGVQVVKIMATGGFLTTRTQPGAPQFGADTLRAVTRLAHRLRLPVAAHAHGTQGIRDAVEAGCDTIEHCTWVGDGRLEFDRAVVDRMVDLGTVVCPTVNGNARNPSGRIDWRERREHLRELIEAGVPVIAGTDAGIQNIAHGSLVDGLEIMPDFGLTPRQVLRSATAGAALALGLSDTTGRIAGGHDADLIAVGGDPTADLTVLRAPALVVSRGVAVRVPDGMAWPHPVKLDRKA
ncbi:amidohydrolase family protein [Micromonospora tulbaghiae]|uniref:amidohydrolase family protein n=1 Tax=Micromonospora tulbaghiae TaxID=479978 RepID=UPI003EBD208F